MMVATYLVNLLCAMVECRGTMSPPEAFIAEYQQQPRPNGQEPLARREYVIDAFNLSDGITIGSRSGFMDDTQLSPVSRQKRVFPLFRGNNPSASSTGNGGGGGGTVLQSAMSNLVNSIPNFFDSLSRVMTNGNALDNYGLNFRMGRRIEDTVRRNAQGDVFPVVYLKHGGGVEGYYMGTMSGRKIAAYEGIPYAEQPIGNRRFKPPVPKKAWKGIMQAKKVGSTCLQTHPLNFFRVTGDERCLFANVYTPQIPYRDYRELYPVIIFIHGGSFMYGSGSEYGPAYFLDKDILLVTFNYRLGALGFLSTGDHESPGNFGLKDQALLIKWVYENIANFGGDPQRITISGQSAGAVSAHLHLVANKVTPYFQNGMSMSGSGFGFWPVLKRERASRLTKSLAKRLNCPNRSSSELIRCLKGISGSWIIMSQLQLFDWIPFHPLVLFAPVVEPEGPNSYLTRWPEHAYARNEVERKPWIFGQTQNEGHFETYTLKLLMQGPTISLNPRRYLPMILDYDFDTSEPQTSIITERLINFYNNGEYTSNGLLSSASGLTMNVISDMYTDRYYSNTVQKAIHAHSQIAPTKTYAYIFDYTGKYNLGELFGIPKSEWGSAHTEDAFLLFNSSSFHHGLKRKDPEFQLSEIMTNIITNFAASSNPVYLSSNQSKLELWENAVDYLDGLGPKIRYLNFAKDVTMIDDPFADRVKFWNTLGIAT